MQLSFELAKWKDEATKETKLRQADQDEIMRLQIILSEVQIDNQSLGEYLKQWKSVAEESKRSVTKYCGKLNSIFIAIKEMRSELPCTCAEHQDMLSSAEENWVD